MNISFLTFIEAFISDKSPTGPKKNTEISHDKAHALHMVNLLWEERSTFHFLKDLSVYFQFSKLVISLLVGTRKK